ncbi:hypothetical protein MMC22_001761 [Lobaria immixta]|nr:hypothetical protein [Lobaria immixta]
MGTRGYRVIRFGGRYYRFYNPRDSNPEALGKSIVSEIPTDPEAYQQWLANKRKEALGWHMALNKFLSRKRTGYEGGDDVEENADEVKEDANEHPWGVATETLPDFMPAFNDFLIEWVYTIDLEYEVFTVDNGAHFRLNQIPALPTSTWINAIANGQHYDRLLLPSSVPEEAIADLTTALPPPAAGKLELYAKLDVQIVKAKGLSAFPPMQRHGPILRGRIFHFFQKIYEPTLSAILLEWVPDDSIFQEIAYAILSLASASLNFSMVPLQQISRERIGYANLKNINKGERNEFLAHLGVGSHLKGFIPGSATASTMYWFDRVLVYLVAELEWPEFVNAAVASVVEHCQDQRPDQCTDGILMSIEHIILMRIHPGGRVERTKPLRLFKLFHTSLRASDRYSEEELEKLQIRKEQEIELEELVYQAHLQYQARRQWHNASRQETKGKLHDKQQDPNTEEKGRLHDKQQDPNTEEKAGLQGVQSVSGMEDEVGLQDKPSDSDPKEEPDYTHQTCKPAPQSLSLPVAESTESTFIALIHFLETSIRRQLPPSRPKGDVFPTEIYQKILHVSDLQTHRACMQVSRVFRDLCQEHLMMMDDAVFEANDASRAYDQSSAFFPALRMKTASTGHSQDVALEHISREDGHSNRENPCWLVVVGNERNRRSIVPDLAVAFRSIKELRST